MSVVNKALEPLLEQSRSNKNQNVVVGMHFKEEEKPKSNNKPYIIIVFLFISVSFFTYDRFSNKTADVRIEKDEPIAIEAVLVNKPFEYIDSENNIKVPESVLDFVNSYSFIPSNITDDNESKVIIYEIIDQVDNSKKIEVFLREAIILLKGDKLTSPKGNNAFERYQMVLSLDSSNKDAVEGINRIVSRYVTLAERVINTNESYKVAGLIKNAYFVGGKYIDMKPIVIKYADYIDDQSVFINIPFENMGVNINASNSSDILKENNKILSIGQSIKDVDRDIALAASKLIKDNNSDGAITVLKRFASLSDYWGKSYDLLFILYLKQLKLKKAELLVSTNTTLDTFQLAEKVAHLFIAGEDIKGALNLLSGYSPDIYKYNEYYAIKAGLHHYRGQYNQAIDIYRKLINIDHDNSRYWLGLAVSLEAVSDSGADDAFHYAYKYSLPNSNVKEYIEQRLLVLFQ
ncbi:MAG: tetratricopeptide (TPR) repeat protein [Cellvibrionaceae bacterium]|jgi:tetratricopeptide (TPR) repeat protein